MKHLLKQSTESVTGLKTNVFQDARIRLTLYYIFVMVVVVGTFSAMLYVTLEKNIKDSIEENVSDRNVQIETIEKTVDRLKITIAALDGFILLLISSLSYILAGKTLKPIAQALDAQKQFSADASHDLRTPLAIMRTDIEVTLNEKNKTPEQYRKTLESNLEEVKHMSDIVENLLLLSRLEGKKTSQASQEFEFSVFVEKIVKKFQAQARAKHISLTIHKKDTGNISGVPSDLERALYNILQNALHYTRDYGKISVTVFKEKDQMHLAIADSGIGISEADLPFVFDRFFKTSDSRNEFVARSGLGLTIAREIIKDHGGTISLLSELGKGTTVNIILPCSM